MMRCTALPSLPVFGIGLRNAMLFALTTALASGALWRHAAIHSSALFLIQDAAQLLKGQDNIYNILTALVFGVSSLNVLGLVTRPYESRRRNLRAGEIMAIAVVVISVGFLGWEMLHVFHVFPLRLRS